MNIREYEFNLYNALMRNYGELRKIYAGVEGAKQLAREIGYALRDYSEKEAVEFTKSSYSAIAVRFYNFHPPVNAKEWIMEMRKAANLDRNR